MLLNGLNDGQDPRMQQVQQQMQAMEGQMRELARENQRLSSSQVLPKTGRDETEKMLKDIT